VLLAGEGDPLSRFSRIQSKLSGLTRVCSYDRIGEGTSSRPRSSQTLADSAAILHKLLAKLHVASHGVVLVGHSLGGLIGARYASLYHSQVKAIVLLDASPPSVEARIKATHSVRRHRAGGRGPQRDYRARFRPQRRTARVHGQAAALDREHPAHRRASCRR
jgi:pimeloyl-ACP methyl ester carboxylesterase